MGHEAGFYEEEPGSKVRCVLCPHQCLIADHRSGICRVRANEGGVLYSKIYGEVTSSSMDPVEKKPLFHFYPGREIFSIGSWGCTFRCSFCQNWQISQQQIASDHFEKEEIVNTAMENGSLGVAYTYNEPTVWYEFVCDTAKLAREKGLKNVMVTNGYIMEEPLKEILPFIDAMNIDLKAFDDKFYREICGGHLEPVLSAIRQAAASGTHVELTTLVIPGLNDGEDIAKIADWVSGVSPDIPLHLSRYFPNYKMDLDPTGLETMKTAYGIAREKLKYVYLGNLPADAGGTDTFCPACGKPVIKRGRMRVDMAGMKDGKCLNCGTEIRGKF
jgi:pyruvate formate lyase activating enzyme